MKMADSELELQLKNTPFWQTLRFRFALWVAGLLCAVLIVFSSFVYLSLKNGLLTAVDDSLQLSAIQANAAVNFENGQINFSDSVPEGPTASDLVERGLTIRILSPQGNIIEAFGPYRNLPFSPSSLSTAQQNQSEFFTITDLTESEPVRFYSAPIIQNGSLAGIVQVAQSLGPVDDTLTRLLTTILLGIPLLIVIAGLGGYFLAARALAPIDKMTRTAQRISAEDLSARLDLPGTNDEVGRLAATFDQMIQHLDEAFRRERRFTADASHELRTPLAAMQAIISVIREEPRSPEDYEFALDDLAEETDRLRTLTEDLLRLARNDTNNSYEFEPLDLSTLLTDLTESLQPLVEKKGLVLKSEIVDNLTITGDSDALIRLFVNLLDNAIKYTPEGEITCCLRHTSDGFVEVSITDSGSGIPEEDLPHIFKRFYRVEQSRSTRGSGLGLSIASQIAQAHGGNIIATSTVGKGATFLVRLPGTPPTSRYVD
jgi:heavy metal sensor kinase